MPDSDRAALEILHRYKRGEIRMEAALVALRAALPHLASPAGDVAELVDEFAIAASDLAIATGTDAWDARGERYNEAKAALVASIATISVERDEAVRQRDTAIQDTLAGITPWLDCQDRMRAAEAARDALAERLRILTKAYRAVTGGPADAR